MPILAFVLVFVIIYAVLKKTGIFGESNFIYSIIALVMSLIFIITPLARQYTLTTTPVLVVFLVCTFFILFIVGFVHGGLTDIMKNPRIAQVALVVILLIFFFTAISVFGPSLSKFAPWNSGEGLTPSESGFKNFIFHPSVLGVIALFIVAALTAWAMNK